MSAPHRMVGRVLDGVLDGASASVRTLTGGCRAMGENLMSGLDGPVREVTGKTGPHRIIDSAMDGSVSAAENAICNGMIGSMKQAGEGIARGLDNPVEQIGLPPKDIGTVGIMR